MNLKIIALSNYYYREVTLNWVKHIERLGIENYEIVCTDELCHEYLKKRGIKVGLFEMPTLRKRVSLSRIRRGLRQVVKQTFLSYVRRGRNGWTGKSDAKGNKHSMIWKLMAARNFLRNGYDTLLSDTDALWLKDPIQDLFYSHSNDVIASTVWASNAFPPKFREKYGYTLCMGWIGFKSNLKVISYLDRVLFEVEKQNEGSDQRAFNHFLMGRNPSIRKSDLGDVFTADDVRILALRQELVKRGKYVQGTYVWHPNSGKNPEAKKRVLGDQWLL